MIDPLKPTTQAASTCHTWNVRDLLSASVFFRSHGFVGIPRSLGFALYIYRLEVVLLTSLG